MLNIFSLSPEIQLVGSTLIIGPSVLNDFITEPSDILNTLVLLLDEPEIRY